MCPGSSSTDSSSTPTAAAERTEPIDAARRRSNAVSRTVARLQAVAWLALLLPTAGYVAVAAWQYHEELAEARGQLWGNARIVQEHALKLLDTNEMLLQRMLDLTGDDSSEQLLQRGADLHQRLRAMASSLPQVQGLFINDERARAVANSLVHPAPRHIDYSDRTWYRWHRDAANPPLFVSERLTSRISGEAAFDVSRRRVAASGGHAGSVHVSLKPQYLTDFWAELGQTQPALRVALLRTGGDFLARWPDAVPDGGLQQHPIIARVAAGETAGHADGDAVFDAAGDAKLRVFRRLAGYPLLVVVATDRSAVLADWRRRMGLLALFVFPTALGFALSALQALRRTRTELAAVERLGAEAERRERAEQALAHAQRFEAMGRLTGGVAHDFNNVLAIVASNAEVLKRRHPALAEAPALAGIARAVDSGTKLTRQLLAFARKQALVIERVALAERLPGLLELVRPVLGPGIELEAEVAPDTGTLEIDGAELELALINLAMNAADAMQRHGRLRIQARRARAEEVREMLPAAADRPFVLIDVDDEGPGIPAADAERVFEPFFTTKPPGSGTGLGLAQVRNLCRTAGGDARMLPGPLGGARVRLLMAAADAHVAPAPDAAAPAALPAEGPPRRLLLVEDNADVAASTQALLESMGWRVQRAGTADEALALLDSGSEPPDVVLSDVQMPSGTDGIDLADRLAGRRPLVPVVLITGYAGRIEQARAHGHTVLPKPCSAQVLGEALARAVQRGAVAVAVAG